MTHKKYMKLVSAMADLRNKQDQVRQKMDQLEITTAMTFLWPDAWDDDCYPACSIKRPVNNRMSAQLLWRNTVVLSRYKRGDSKTVLQSKEFDLAKCPWPVVSYLAKRHKLILPPTLDMDEGKRIKMGMTYIDKRRREMSESKHRRLH